MNINEFKKLSRIKPKNDPYAEYDEPIKAEKWVNLFFLHDGTSYKSIRLFDSEHAAQVDAEDAKEPGFIIEFSLYGVLVYPEEISHAIPMPVKP